MKEYVKPELYYESFELSQHIAGCNLTMQQNDTNNCNYAAGTIDGMYSNAWFLSGITECVNQVQDFCYTNGSANHITINS